MKAFRLTLMGSVVAGVGAVAAADASAADVEKIVKAYGHVNRMVGIQDDGHSTTVNHYDNDISASSFGVVAAAGSPDLAIGAKFEWTFNAGSNNDAVTTQTNNANGSRGNQSVRYSDIFFATRYGKVSMGYGNSAAMSAANSDLSGTDLAMSVGEPLSKGMGFVPKLNNWDANNGGNGTAATTAAVQVGDVLNRHDGAKRNRILYDTPRFAGVGASISHGQADVGEYRLDYKAIFFNTKLAAAVAMVNASGSTTQFERTYLSSISARHSSGVNLTYAYTVQNQNSSGSMGGAGVATAADNHTLGRRPQTQYAKIGYSQDFFGIGNTNLAIDWNLGRDGSRDGDRVVKWGGGVVQNLNAYGAELYAAYENINYVRGGSGGVNAAGSAYPNYETINAGYFGARVRF